MLPVCGKGVGLPVCMGGKLGGERPFKLIRCNVLMKRLLLAVSAYVVRAALKLKGAAAVALILVGRAAEASFAA